MTEIFERIKREPALVSSLVAAILLAGASFGLTLTDAQSASINAVVVAILAFVVRSQVTPNASVAAKEAEAVKADAENRELVAGKAAPVPEGEPVTVAPEGVVETQQDASLPPRQSELL